MSIPPKAIQFAGVSAFLIILFGSYADAQDGSSLDFKQIDPNLSNYGYVSRDHLWPRDQRISVCWENQSQTTAEQRKIIEQSVEDTWEKYTSIQFTGWANACTENVRGVHIFIVDEQPRSLIGRRLDGVSKGVRLNITFANWSHEYCYNNINSCIRTVTIHEWGHVLGFIHESLSPDAPPSCKATAIVQKDDSDPGDGREVTVYDPASIMNYCTLIYGRQITLSPLDIKAAGLLYPKAAT